MKCLICDKSFIVKRKLEDLFKYESYFICDKCLKDFPYEIEYNVIPLNESRNLRILTLLDWNNQVNIEAYIKEFSYMISRYRREDIFITDVLNITDEVIEVFESYSKLISGDIYLYAFRCRI